MARSSITGADRAPTQAEGRDVETLGPSDTSDSGSDVQGELELAPPIDLDNPIAGQVQPGLGSDSDSGGTGERGAALTDEEGGEGADILPDSIRSLADEADASEDVAAEAELEFAELTDADDFAVPDDDEDDDAS
ncbi:hypothetical protein [Piscinibacter sp. XHJ-5]|uniref:hypothetical protein n=1 Tax=Piscinibacter sp. XHJ-5 TaxID=3037797 RepID=UPI002452C073|nr:hypothetical protein [Piscinibacter sp. XHJ-5]